MRRVTQYFIKTLLGPLFLITLTLTGVIWLTQSIKFIDFIINRGVSLWTFIYLSSLLVPALLLTILPLATYVSIIFTYYKFLMDSELVVLKSIGMSRLALAKPALIVAGMITILSYALSLYIVPTTHREFKDLQVFIRDHYASILLQEAVFNHPIDKLTVYLEERTETGQLTGLFVQDDRNPNSSITMMAQSGEILQTPSGPHLNLYHGNRQEVGKQSRALSFLTFERYELNLGGITSVNEQRMRGPNELYLHQLLDSTKTPSYLKNKYFSELHQRLSWPLFNMILALLALATILSGQFNRRGQWKRIWISAFFAIMIIIIGISMVDIIAKHPIAVWALYIQMLVISIISLWIMLLPPKKAHAFTPSSGSKSISPQQNGVS